MSVSRRTLLKLGAGASLTAGANASAWATKSNPVKDIRVGVIGAGVRGRGLLNILSSTPGFQVRAIADILPESIQKAKEIIGSGLVVYSDYRKLLDDKTIDAVVIATPFSMHTDMAMAAIDSRKHVYCEKTLAYGIKEAQALYRKARTSERIFQTGHQYRSSPAYRNAVSLIRNGYLGDITHIESQWNRNSNWRRKVSDPKLERLINWRMYREYSGGLTAELCSHHIDFANWVLGDHPIRVVGLGGIDTYHDGRETYDNVQILTRYRSGVSATFKCLTANAKGGSQIKVLGNKGSLVLEFGTVWAFVEANTKEKLQGEVDGVSGATLQAWRNDKGVKLKIEDNNATKNALIEFRDSIVTGQQPKSNALTGATVSIIVQMALDAMDNKTTEDWKNDYTLA